MQAGLPADRVNLQVTGELRAGLRVVKTERGYGLGWATDELAQRAHALEVKYGKPIWMPSESEKATFRETVQNRLNDYLNGDDDGIRHLQASYADMAGDGDKPPQMKVTSTGKPAVKKIRPLVWLGARMANPFVEVGSAVGGALVGMAYQVSNEGWHEGGAYHPESRPEWTNTYYKVSDEFRIVKAAGDGEMDSDHPPMKQGGELLADAAEVATVLAWEPIKFPSAVAHKIGEAGEWVTSFYVNHIVKGFFFEWTIEKPMDWTSESGEKQDKKEEKNEK